MQLNAISVTEVDETHYAAAWEGLNDLSPVPHAVLGELGAAEGAFVRSLREGRWGVGLEVRVEAGRELAQGLSGGAAGHLQEEGDGGEDFRR